MSSPWNHSLCDRCWTARNPGRSPVVVPDSKGVRCCACGQWNAAGIWTRADPAELACQGKHPAGGPPEDEAPFDNALVLQVGGVVVALPLTPEGDVDQTAGAASKGIAAKDVGAFLLAALLRVLRQTMGEEGQRMMRALIFGGPAARDVGVDAREMSEAEAREGYALRDKVAELVGPAFVLVVPYDDPKRAGWSCRGANIYSKGFDAAALRATFTRVLEQAASGVELREGAPMELGLRPTSGDA